MEVGHGCGGGKEMRRVCKGVGCTRCRYGGIESSMRRCGGGGGKEGRHVCGGGMGMRCMCGGSGVVRRVCRGDREVERV